MNNDPLVGKMIDDRYEIQQRVGEGGMGVVYKARQISIDRVIALKMLNPQMANDPTWVQRFYNEAKACSRLQHPNTIRMFDFGQTKEGRLFMTMEFLDGISLRQALQNGALAPQRVVKVLIQCCASLAEAHSIGIIHRDIKPDNVFLLNMAGSPDFVKLLDFSVAKLLEGDRMKTQAGVVFGTPQYMSPEQGRGLPLDARSDLYALGILAFEMLTGNVPFHDENPMTVIQMHLHAGVPPMPETVPYPVQQIVRRALEKDAGRRYQSSGEMMQQCQQVFAEISQGGVSIGAGGMPRTMIAPNPNVQAPAHMQQAGMQQQPQQPQHQGYQQASPQQKTMVAQMSPFAQGGAPQQGAFAQGSAQQAGVMPQQQSGLAPQQQHPGFQQASPQQKTIVAGMVAPGQLQQLQQMAANQMAMQGGMQGGMPPGMQPTLPPNAMVPPGMPNAPGMGMQQPMLGMQPGMPGMQQPGMPGMQMPQQPGAPQKTIALQSTEGVVSMARTGQAVQPAGTGAIQQGASTLFWIMSLIVGIAIGALAYVIVRQM